jgi:hypothetical protein
MLLADIQVSTLDLSSQVIVHDAVLRDYAYPGFASFFWQFVCFCRNSENSDSNVLSTCPAAIYGAIRSWHRQKTMIFEIFTLRLA